MQNYQAELDFETEHLAQVIALAHKQLSEIRHSNGQRQSDVIAAKKDLWENTSHSVSNLWSKDSFYELAALSQYVNQVSNKISALELEATKAQELERMLQSPYFARIDFRFAGEENSQQVYIGRASLMDKQKMQLYVYDWRAPLASVFYRFGVGSVFYDAPQGRVCGEVSLKRQFEIRTGTLDYFFDADVQIMDEFLKKLLAQNASAKMKAIVETIQKDQDVIIRDMENDLMMVQGVAGSGKTSVALHRVAYLMYQGLADKLSAHNIMIISPNTVFEQYISNVLPELGEDNVVTVTFEKIIGDLLGGRPIQSKNGRLESLITCRDSAKRRLMKSALGFKTSGQFKEIIERFINDIPRKWLEFSDVEYDGKCIADRSLLKARVLAAPHKPLTVRLQQLEQAIWEQVHQLRPNRMEKLRRFIARREGHMFEVEECARLLSIAESTVLHEKIHKFTTLDTFALYKKLFADARYFQRLARGVPLPADIEEILAFSQENLQAEQLPYEDGLALAYLHLRLTGFYHAKHIKQVVIDEAQDYYPLHFEILKILFPEARYTILGDVQQTIEKPTDLSLFDEIKHILAKHKSALVTMNKSFRCTAEILNFSKQFLAPGTELESFSRPGEQPKIYAAQDQKALDELIITEIHRCQEAQYQSIGLLCKTEQDAVSLHGRLKEQAQARLITSDAITELAGVFILPLYLAKGLEFDAVLLCDVDQEHYYSEDDKKLLYIGCTRALHRLSLFYRGDKSALLG